MAIGPPRGTFVYAALTFDKLGKALAIWLKSLAISKCPRPFAFGLLVHLSRIRRAENNNRKRLKVSDRNRVAGHLKRLM